MRIDEVVDGLIDPNAADTDGFSEQAAAALASRRRRRRRGSRRAKRKRSDEDVAAHANAKARSRNSSAVAREVRRCQRWFDKMRRAFEKERYIGRRT